VNNIPPNVTTVAPFVTADGYSFDLENFSQSNIAFGTSPNGQTTATVATNGTWFGPGGQSVGAGTFTAQVTNPTTYSASITATPITPSVPEPSESLGVLTLGAVGGMFVLRNRKSQTVNS
jgi:hypothetical protein